MTPPTPTLIPDEGRELVHAFRNSLLAVQFGMVALEHAWGENNNEHFKATFADMERELKVMKDLITRTDEALRVKQDRPV